MRRFGMRVNALLNGGSAFFSTRAKMMLPDVIESRMWCVAECDAVVMSGNVIQCTMMCNDVDLKKMIAFWEKMICHPGASGKLVFKP